MKRLLIIRHAKSSWDDASMKDIDRPLNDRGKKDAPAMAQRLIKADITIDRFVASPAKRARHTAEAFMQELGIREKELDIVPELYHAQIQNFKNVIQSLDDNLETVALFSHNPGITAFASVISTVRIDNMPTCAIFAVTSPTRHWSDFVKSGPAFWFFDYPKSAGGGD